MFVQMLRRNAQRRRAMGIGARYQPLARPPNLSASVYAPHPLLGEASWANAQDGLYGSDLQAFIDLWDIQKAYTTDAGPFLALKGIDLSIWHGEFVAIVGRSGSGKSTLINMISGIDQPTNGDVLVGNTMVNTLNEGEAALWRGQQIGLIFQFFQLLPTLSILENIMLPMDFCRIVPFSERPARAMHLLELVGMAEHADKLPSATSGGQQQRVAIARSLANDPPLIIADEPTGNLDSRTAERIFQLFEELVALGKTVLVVTHDSELAQRMSRVITIADGEIMYDSVPDASSAWVDQLPEGRKVRQLENSAHYKVGTTHAEESKVSDLALSTAAYRSMPFR